jgi:hypothetical protein
MKCGICAPVLGPSLRSFLAVGTGFEPVFVILYGAQESIPRNRFRQPMWLGGPVRKIGLSYWPARLGIDSWAPQMSTNTPGSDLKTHSHKTLPPSPPPDPMYVQ